MDFGNVTGDVIVLVFYIILTIVLILFGKLVGKTAYGWYWSIDPGSYQMDNHWDLHGEKNKTPEQLNKEALERAEEAGRSTGAWIGFLIGGVLSMVKAYNIYTKLRM